MCLICKNVWYEWFCKVQHKREWTRTNQKTKPGANLTQTNPHPWELDFYVTTNTSPGQVSSLSVVRSVILGSDHCEQKDTEHRTCCQSPLFLLRLGTTSSSPPVRRHLQESCGSVCVCLCMWEKSWLHNLALALFIIHRFCRNRWQNQHTGNVLGKTSLKARTPGGLQLDSKYLTKHRGVLITSDCWERQRPRAYRGYACLE